MEICPADWWPQFLVQGKQKSVREETTGYNRADEVYFRTAGRAGVSGTVQGTDFITKECSKLQRGCRFVS